MSTSDSSREWGIRLDGILMESIYSKMQGQDKTTIHSYNILHMEHISKDCRIWQYGTLFIPFRVPSSDTLARRAVYSAIVGPADVTKL